ncbi:Layilin [Pitangus sulphuratus]|nr:Layilin [Pitangus sulphuratus]
MIARSAAWGTGYEEAQRACRADGGHLVSIESPAEQRLIESFISSLLAADGDFWIGLRREKEEEEGNSTECQSFYSWSDGSSAKFRNWYVDEPSCGSEICVVMYHQPSAPPGVGGPYMFQWNDDRCNMKNNFICKYSLEPVQSLAYILIPSIPVLLLLMAITAISCFWLFVRRREQRMDTSPKEEDAWLSNPGGNSPSLDIYKVINKQSEADLAGARPGTQNSSFQAREHRELGRAAPNTSSFVTESGFVTNDIYELCGDRVGRSKESTWVDNEIYGY